MWAATLEPGYGDLTINQGQGFKPINSRVDANVGDSVMVGPGGTATVVYDDGCKVNVQPGAVTTIAPLSPCASGSNAQTGPSYYPDCRTDPDDCGPNWVAIGSVVLTVAVVAGAIYFITKGNGTPASP
jgi:hypothetical protein